MENLAMKSRETVAPLKLGTVTSAQPTSGTTFVDSKAVHGHGRGGFERGQDKTTRH